jgi:hypothetical protein
MVSHYHGVHHEHHHHFDDHNSMRPHTHIAYHHVETACAADVERLCSEELPSFFPFSDAMPMPDWHFHDAPPQFMPEADNIGPLIDQMMESVLAMPISFSIVIIEDSEPMPPPPAAEQVGDAFVSSGLDQEVSYGDQEDSYEGEDSDEGEPMPPPPAAEQVVDAFVSKMAQERPEEIPLLAQQLVEHGHQVLEEEDASEERRHLARRLTEVKPDQMYHSVHLPFGCSKNRCLIAASRDGRVSEPCFATINELQQVNIMEIQFEEQQGAFLGMMWIYVCLMVLLMTLISRRYTQNKSNRRLNLRILKAVYANPSIKAQLEEDLGESVGNVPPVSAHVLQLMTAGGMAFRRQLECARRVQVVFSILLFNLIIFAPFWVLPLCIVVSAMRVAFFCCASFPVRECTCCCCGVSTEDVANGVVTDAQACCNCCVGTGVCSPACASCCGKDGCCCGSEDCCCCKAPELKTVNSCGTGCCCGASPEQVATGTLTDAQACCCCCSGTGCCSGDSCCCGDAALKGRGQGQKHVFQAKEGVYEGVPIQVV